MIMDSTIMIYDTNNNEYVPKWRLEEVEDRYPRSFNLHYFNERTMQLTIRGCDGDKYMHKHIRYLIDYRPELLQQKLNDGTIYRYLTKISRRASQAVWNQVEEWELTDKEYLLAKAGGNILEVTGLLNNLIARAEELMYPRIIYV